MFKPDLKPTKHKFCIANGQGIRCRGEGLMTIEFGGKELYFVILVGDVKRKLEEKGLIEKSISPWSAQTVLVKNKDGKENVR